LLDLQSQLKRTIIFVSHDLDEAFKLGNRIAIMEGGRIVQCGTPQEIMANPVDDYVESFVKHTNPLNVLQAGDVMSSDISGRMDANVVETAPVADVIDALSGGSARILVENDQGEPIGSISNQEIVEALQSKSSRN